MGIDRSQRYEAFRIMKQANETRRRQDSRCWILRKASGLKPAMKENLESFKRGIHRVP